MNFLLKPIVTKIYNNNIDNINNNQYIINDSIYIIDDTQYIITNIIDDKFNNIKFKIDDIENNYIQLKDELLFQNNEIKNINKINKYIIFYLIFNIFIQILISIYKISIYK